MKQRLFIAAILFATASVCSAGTLLKGGWTPTGCGPEPVQPKVNQSTVDSYNKSVAEINKWQKAVSAYNTCVVDEANKDNTTIAKSANAIQSRLQKQTEEVHTKTEAAKAKLDQSSKK